VAANIAPAAASAAKCSLRINFLPSYAASLPPVESLSRIAARDNRHRMAGSHALSPILGK
jgi:hypothetical protein